MFFFLFIYSYLLKKLVTLINPGWPRSLHKRFEKRRIWSSDGISLKIKCRKWNGQMCIFIYLFILCKTTASCDGKKKEEKIKYQGSSALMIAPTRLFCVYEKPPYLPLPVYTDKGYWIGCWALVNPSLLQINSNQTSCDKLRPRRFAQFGNSSPSLLLFVLMVSVVIPAFPFFFK